MPSAKAILLAVLTGVYLTPALAGGPSVPPALYDHPHPDMIVIERSPAEVHRICAAIGGKLTKAGNRFVACAPIGRAKCAIVIPHHHPQKAALIRHERGHCNGWPANHPR